MDWTTFYNSHEYTMPPLKRRQLEIVGKEIHWVSSSVHLCQSVCQEARQRESEWILGATTQLICTERSGVIVPDLLRSTILWSREQPTGEWTRWNGHPGLHKPKHKWQNYRRPDRKWTSALCRCSPPGLYSSLWTSCAQHRWQWRLKDCWQQHKGSVVPTWMHHFCYIGKYWLKHN